ncbi:hypothetical protein TIFTF001_014000 [Ficus carica]|uniref:Uncharacterized protein n=1 Tax=Ficus carica TaxID=3494 RepID=A0AA88A324_FICCA|nr:hypothetical protein TIFTF001_014000 [Ficus carica]
MLRLVACKREVPRSKGDTSEVSDKGTPILKSVRNTDEQAKKQSFGRHAPAVQMLDLHLTDATCPTIRVMGGDTGIGVSTGADSKYCVMQSSGCGVLCHNPVVSRYGIAWQGQHGPTIPKGARLWSGKYYPSQYLGSR